MEAYTDFASVYDLCMDTVPYDEWAQAIRDRLTEYGISDGLVCELGCGTGEMTERLSLLGYDMIGIDASEDMLMEAREKLYERTEEERRDILYLLQDMREFELYGTVRAFVSVCDSMNYLLTEQDLLKVFRLVNNYLDRNGIFLFDMKTEACYLEMGNETRAENFNGAAVIWENAYKKRKKQNTYRVTMFLREHGDLYRKSTEIHVQQAYTPEQVKKLLAEAGMEFLAVWDVETGLPVTKETKRMMFAAREGFQPGKCYETE